MKHTSLNFYSGFPPFETTGWTVVFQHNVSVGSPGWRYFSFDTPFEYNGTDNLLIDFSHNNSSHSTDGGCNISDPFTGSDRVLYSYADDFEGYGDPLNWANVPRGLDSYAPYIKLISTVPAQPITGDFEPDCDVDFYDFTVLALAWMSEPGDGNWNPDCNLYPPEIINFLESPDFFTILIQNVLPDELFYVRNQFHYTIILKIKDSLKK